MNAAPSSSRRQMHPVYRLRSSVARPAASAALSKNPPAEPEALRLLAPQRGLIATDIRCSIHNEYLYFVIVIAILIVIGS